MSVKMRDLLQLPSLSRTHVMAGEANLDRVVSTVSVIDFTATSVAQRELYQPENSATEQLLLSSVDQMPKDVKTIESRVEQLTKTGCVGIVVFYKGETVPEIDPAVKTVADQLNFLVIFAQEMQPNLTYSAVISEIMFAIFQARTQQANLEKTIIGKVAALPESKRSVSEVLQRLATQLNVAIALIDEKHEIIYRETAPDQTAVNWNELVELVNRIDHNGQLPIMMANGMKVSQWSLSDSNLTVLMVGQASIDNLTSEHVAETVQTALHLWGNQVQDEQNLIHAILQNQVVRAAQLGRERHFDPRQICAALVVECPNGRNKKQLKTYVDQLTQTFVPNVVSDWYDGRLIVLFNDELSYQNWLAWQKQFVSVDEQIATGCNVIFAAMTDGISGTQRLYQAVNQYGSAMKIVLPRQQFFNQTDLEFARSCQRALQEEGTAVIRWQKRLDSLPHSLVATLLTFLLDTPQNIEQAGEILYVHRNTIKYRLNKISNYFGFIPGVMPASFELYQALGIHRLLRGAETMDTLNK